jgi:signal transduction histidine kinase
MVHPISIFVAMQFLSISLISLWVVWFMGRQRDIDELANKIGGTNLTSDQSFSVAIMVGGIVALVLVLVGSVLLFIWGQRQASYIQQQRSFVSSVTHELRSPLASMHLANETLLKRVLPEETKKRLLKMTLLDIDRLTKLVNQILISSRLDRGLAMFQDDIKIIKINDRISEVIKSLEHMDGQIQSRVKIDCEQDLSFRFSDNAFNLIIGNIVENAIKYSPLQSPIRIHVQPDGGLIRFSVEDRGIGISKSDRRKVFKMFYRSKFSASRAIQGTGLGLFIVKTSLEQLGGKIEVESEGPGNGSVFHVWLPVI